MVGSARASGHGATLKAQPQSIAGRFQIQKLKPATETSIAGTAQASCLAL